MKFSGMVGFWKGDIETKPGVYRPDIVERHYIGDVLKNTNSFHPSETLNDTFTVSNRISIISDLFLQDNFISIRYVTWNGKKLKVKNVDISNFPRAILEIGGDYNAPNANSTP